MTMNPEPTGLIFDVQRGSMQDGPGIRTTVFFKGCPLRCLWCHNPESHRAQPETGVDEKGRRVRYGEVISAGKLLKQMEEDRVFYEVSGGGVTLSGGEPFFQPEFLLALCRGLKERGICVCVETSGYVKPRILRRTLPWVDLFLFDYKETGRERFVRETGVFPEPILDNLALLDSAGKRIWLRCPIVPGYQDREEHFRCIAALSRQYTCIERVEILPFHSLGRHKYRQLNRPDPTKQTPVPTREETEGWKERLRALGCRHLQE